MLMIRDMNSTQKDDASFSVTEKRKAIHQW